MSWVDIEEAVQKAVVLASGLPSKSVIWSYQNKSEFPMPYVRLHFGGETVIGMDRIASKTDLSRPRGQEVMQKISGVREVPLEIEVFTAEVLGDSAARRLCEIIRTKLRLDSVRIGLTKAGLSPFDPGPVSYVPDIAKANFRGRALCTIRCYVPVMDCLEYVGYIARVRGTLFPIGWTGPSGATGLPFDVTIST